MAKLLVKGTLERFNQFTAEQKAAYNDSIVFLSDTQQILVDGIFYGMSIEAAEKLNDVIDKVNKLNFFNGVADNKGNQCGLDEGERSLLQFNGLEDAIVTVDCDGVSISVSIKEGSVDGTLSINGNDIKLTGFDTLVERVTAIEEDIASFKDEVAKGKVTSVTSKSTAIVVDNTDTTNPILDLKTDNGAGEIGDVTFTYSDNGLAGKVNVPFKAISANDKVLTLADNGHLSTTLGLTYSKRAEGVAAKITLTGKDNTVLAEIDATDFVVDGMLSNAELVDYNAEGVKDGNQYLRLTWNTDSAKDPKTMYVNMKDLIDVYTGQNLILENISVAEADRTNVKNGMSVDTAIGNIVLDIRDIQNTASDNNSAFEAFRDRPEGFATAEQGEKADSAIQTITPAVSGKYITITSEVSDNNITLTPELTIEAMADAGEDPHGLAESADVKKYVNDLLSWETF